MLGTGICISTAIGVLLSIALHRSIRAKVLDDRDSAIAIARIGVSKACPVIAGEPEKRRVGPLFSQVPCNGGTFDVDILSAEPDEVVIRSTGMFRDLQVPIVITLKPSVPEGRTQAGES
jgi:hypothetical protein